MAALSAKTHNAGCRQMYDRLTARGKPKKQALIAVANKLLRQAWAVLHYNQPYIDGYGLKNI